MKSKLASGSIHSAIAGNGAVGLKFNSVMFSSVALFFYCPSKAFCLSLPFPNKVLKCPVLHALYFVPVN